MLFRSHQWKERPIGPANFICLSIGEHQGQEVGVGGWGRVGRTFGLGLRLTKGVDVSAFRENFGRMPEEVYRDVIEKNIQDGLLEYGDGTDRLALTDRGLDLASYVMAQFLLT